MHKRRWAVCEGVSKGYTFFIMQDATKIPLREKPVKVEKEKSLNQKEEDDLKRWNKRA